MKTIILDTDFLVFCAEQKINYESELKRICTPPFNITVLYKTIDELNHVAAKGKTKELTVKLVKTILHAKKTHIMPTPHANTVDELILKTATPDHIICTQDKLLKKALHQKGVFVITARQGKYLVME